MKQVLKNQTAFCVRCGNEYSALRQELGYDTCLVCGEQEAKKEKARKAKCLAPSFNKGPIQYIATKQQALDIGR